MFRIAEGPNRGKDSGNDEDHCEALRSWEEVESGTDRQPGEDQEWDVVIMHIFNVERRGGLQALESAVMLGDGSSGVIDPRLKWKSSLLAGRT